MNANETQVGGTHYKTGFQHWDLVLMLGLPYLPAQVTRYLSRWKKKNGLQDLEKAYHYINKMVEQELERHEQAVALVKNFVRENQLGEEEKSVFNMLVNYQLGDGDRLFMARDAIKRLIEIEKERIAEKAHAAQQEIEEAFATKENLNA